MTTKPTHADAHAHAGKTGHETWYVKLVYAHYEREWVFSCDEVVVQELKDAMAKGRPAHVHYAGTEVLINPQHFATMELQKQEPKK